VVRRAVLVLAWLVLALPRVPLVPLGPGPLQWHRNDRHMLL
jgi:hypothetical protein